MAMELDSHEEKVLRSYAAENADYWVSPWATTVHHELAPAVAIAVARRLCTRKLLEGNDERGKWRGYTITDKGVDVLTKLDAQLPTGSGD